MKKRCPWVNSEDPLILTYHDEEWGVPVHDDRRLFEMLVLEGAQAGLNWTTILKKRKGYRQAFADFDPVKVAAFDEKKVTKLLADSGIVRNRRKIESGISNAKSFLAVQKEYGSFDSYVWSFVDAKPVRNRWRRLAQIPASSPVAKTMSADLLNRGFRFVGPTICYAYMQAIGMVNDHLLDCFRYSEIH
jgi:DNA-3-methyladenine glycosylase I